MRQQPARCALMGWFSLVLAFCLMGCAASSFASDRDYREKINDTTLHFRVRGADPTNPYLLILHGGPGFSAHMFYPWGKSLEGRLNVVYLDQRGCGESERIKFANPTMPSTDECKDYTVTNLIADIEGVRAFLKVDRWFVLGHSWGGMLGLNYVIAHSDAVIGFIDMDGDLSQPEIQSAILSNAQAYLEGQPTKPDDKSARAVMLQLADINDLKAMKPCPTRLYGALGYISVIFSRTYYVNPERGTEYSKAIAAEMERYKLPLSLMMAPEPTVALTHADNYAGRDDTPLLPGVHVPTLIVSGAQDMLVPARQARLAHSKIRGSDLVLISDCGHFPFVEQPKRTTEAILTFVDHVQKSSKP